MKHIRRDLYSNRIIYRKYAKNYHRHNMNILTFLKSNYKYKRRNTRHYYSSDKQQRQQWYLPHRQQKQKYKHKFPVRSEEILTDDKQINKRNSIYENIKLDKFLRIFILIMQQATTTAKIINNNKNNNSNSNICNNQSKGENGRLVTRLVAKMKAIKKKHKTNKTLTKINVSDNDRYEIENKNRDGDGIISEDHNFHHHYAYKDANKDTDISHIVDEISHQQHNYDKVSTITSTPIKCQRRKHHQMKTIKSISSSSSLSPLSFSFTTTTAVTTTSSPLTGNYETCQCSAILYHYDRHNSWFHQHQYHHKIKYIHTQYHQQQQPCHAHHYMKSLMATKVLNINKNCNNSSSKNKNKNFSNNTTPNVTTGGTSNNYPSVDQCVNATWNRSYTLSCLLLTLFIALSIGVRSTTAGACWQTVLDNGKCNEIFSLNISKSECCGANQEFAYTEREPTNVEYFFATAIGGGMECSPCLESCKNVKCGPNKKCVKRKGRPKCICAPECGAARRKRKQREHFMQQETQSHTLHLVGTHIRDSRDVNNDEAGDDDDDDNDDHGDEGYIADMAEAIEFPNAFKIKLEKSQQSRDTRSLSSEITNINLGLKTDKDAMMMLNSGEMSPMERHHCKEHIQNQRKTKHIHMHHTLIHTHANDQQQRSQDSNHKNQEPKGSRRLLITANVEHTEKPTTRRLQILSNVRTTHARRYNSKKNKNDHSPEEDTDPSDYDEAVEVEESNKNNDEDYNYNDAEDDAKEPKKKSINNSSSNGNSNSNKNNRNDDSTRFLNQSMSRHKLKTNTKSNNNSNSSNSNKGRNRNSGSNKNNKKNQHDLQRTKIQQHSSNNNTRIRHPQQNGRHAENTPHYRHHHQHHSQSHHQQHQPHHRQKQQLQQQQHNLNHNNQQQSPIHGRHKHNKQQKHHQQQHHHKHKQQTIVLKIPKNNKDYNITTTNNISVANTIATKNHNNNNNNDNSNSGFTDATAVTATILMHQSRLGKTSTATTTQTSLNLSSAISSLSSTTPVNSTMSANDDNDAAADDHYHSRLPNHGNKVTTSSLSPSAVVLPSAASSSSYSTAATTIVKMSAKGEGVSLHDQNIHHIQIPTKIAVNNNNNNKKKNDNIISTFQSNLHNTQQQQDQQQETQSTQSQQEQQHQQFQTPLFDGFYEQFDLIGFPNHKQFKQQTITNEDNVRPLNPVCGTDGRTYNTECQLRKRACRTDNPNLQISYRGHCRTTCNGVKCINGLTCVEDQYSMPHCIACKIECPQDDYVNDAVDATRAVCGADGKTYKSTCDINRMICKIGRSIGVAYPGPCRAEQVTCDDINCGPKQVCLIDLLTHKPRCTSCRYKCSRKRRPSYPHFDEGKICGVNNHTYNSWCEMLKDSCSTGFYIDVKYSGSCH